MPAAALPPLVLAMAEAKRILWRVGGFSFFINLLVLTSPLYMLQVYDRVLSARSESTLFYLTLFALACLAILGAIELVRSRILVRMGAQFDALLANKVFTIVLSKGRSGQLFRDLDALRTFLTGSAMLALLDAPWTPLYVVLVYALHPMLGHVALFGVVVLLALGLVNERMTRAPLAQAGAEMATSTRFAELSARNAEAVRAMGMLPGLHSVWRVSHGRGLALQAQASDRAGDIAALAKFVRFLLQVAILGVGAYLVIIQESTGGVMIAASIIMGRGLAPVETSIGAWRGFLMARMAYLRLKEEFADMQQDDEPMALPPPTGEVQVDKLVGGPPGVAKPVVAGATFHVNAGNCLGIAGPSAAGKSTLARLLVGVWRPTSGEVRLDHVNIADWRREEVGPHIGYLPQDIELFPASVGVNIARFNKVDPEKVVEAAKLAGAHETILELPDGYDTLIGVGGNELSGGQRQKIALARAFYGSPALIVLDEPTSNLDAEGEAAVCQAIEQLKQRRRTVVVIAHRPNVLAVTDALMVLQKGVITQFGKTSEVMAQLSRPAPALPESRGGARVAG